MENSQQLAALCAALGYLTGAGISLYDAFFLLARDEQDARLRKLWEQMASQAAQGKSLAATIREADCFPGYMCTLLEAGEQVGSPHQTLHALAQYYDRRSKLTRQIKATLSYPAMLLAVLLGVLGVLLIYVLPVFQQVYAQLGSSLTGLAGGLLQLGQLLGKALPWLLGILVLLALVLFLPALRTRVLRGLKAKFGDRGALAQVNSARFLQALSLGITSGMTSQEAATLAGKMATGEIPGFAARCARLLSRINDGMPLYTALPAEGFLTPPQARLLEVGQRSGQMDRVLSDLAREAVDQSQENLSKQAERIEPALVALACGLIGLVLLSVMLPLMNIMNGIG